jgi:hypothetical protein
MADQAARAGTEAGIARGKEETPLQAELAQLDEEIQRLRQLLVDRDLELGKAKGRLVEIHDHPLRFAAATARGRFGPRALARRVVALLRKRPGRGSGA